MTMRGLALCAALAVIYPAALAGADQPSDASGHWEGTLSAPTPKGNQDVPLTVDLARGAGGAWTGSVDIGPLAKGLALTEINANGATVRFAVKNAPGAPSFDGKLGADGKTMSGNVTLGGQTTTFKLTHTGEAKVAEAPKSTPISKQLQGSWEGALQANGQTLHLVVDLKPEADGTAAGILTSVDQGNSQIPLSQVTQDGQAVTFSVQVIGGKFTGTMNAAGTELKGEWTQGPNALPLTLTRQAAAPAATGNAPAK